MGLRIYLCLCFNEHVEAGGHRNMVTDTELIQNAQYRLLENGNADANGTTLLTDMWTMTEIIDAIANSI